ncbi:hypothetical protein, conserved in T. vivax, partial [Trypanosoma vivax Y486]
SVPSFPLSGLSCRRVALRQALPASVPLQMRLCHAVPLLFAPVPFPACLWWTLCVPPIAFRLLTPPCLAASACCQFRAGCPASLRLASLCCSHFVPGLSVPVRLCCPDLCCSPPVVLCVAPI